MASICAIVTLSWEHRIFRFLAFKLHFKLYEFMVLGSATLGSKWHLKDFCFTSNYNKMCNEVV